MIGFWMYSNRQVFENVVVFKERLSETTRYDHQILESITRLSPGSPLLLLGLIQFLIIARKYYNPKDRELKSYKTWKKLEHKLSKAHFTRCLSPGQRKRIISEEKYLN